MWMMKLPICLALVIVMPARVQAADSLPRVLIIGDSVYRQPAAEVAKELKGHVKVVYVTASPRDVLNSSSALKNLGEWLGDEKWDLIHFNFGLGDLVYRAPGTTSFRVLPRFAGGVRATSPELYEKNLAELVERLKLTGSKLVWASTTPIRASTTRVFDLGSEIQYNAIAARVMKASDVPINDMHTSVVNLIDMSRPAGHGADPFHFDKKPIHAPIVKVILSNLDVSVESDASPDPVD